MFRGSFEHTVDGKGRLSIPAKFREVLLGKGDDRIMITNFTVGGVRCLDVYPMDEWLRFEEEIRRSQARRRPGFSPRKVSHLGRRGVEKDLRRRRRKPDAGS